MTSTLTPMSQVFLCCADGEGSHEFRVCADDAAVFKFYEEMTGCDEDGTLDSITKSFGDSDHWRNDGTAFELELYCARFYVWKVAPSELAFASSEIAPSIVDTYKLKIERDAATIREMRAKLVELCQRIGWKGVSRESNLAITAREAMALVAAYDRTAAGVSFVTDTRLGGE